MSDIYRDPTEGAAAKRQDLLRRRRDDLATMPHAIRRVVVARDARVAAGLAMTIGGHEHSRRRIAGLAAVAETRGRASGYRVLQIRIRQNDRRKRRGEHIYTVYCFRTHAESTISGGGIMLSGRGRPAPLHSCLAHTKLAASSVLPLPW